VRELIRIDARGRDTQSKLVLLRPSIIQPPTSRSTFGQTLDYGVTRIQDFSGIQSQFDCSDRTVGGSAQNGIRVRSRQHSEIGQANTDRRRLIIAHLEHDRRKVDAEEMGQTLVGIYPKFCYYKSRHELLVQTRRAQRWLVAHARHWIQTFRGCCNDPAPARANGKASVRHPM